VSDSPGPGPIVPAPIGGASWTGEPVPVSYGYPPRPWPPMEVGEPSRSYHRMLRVRSYRWWKPLVGILLFVVTYVVLLIALFAVPGAVYVAVGGDSATLQDQGTWWVFGLGNITLALLIPCAMLAVWAVHRIRPGYLSSVAGRLRWRWLLLCTGVAFLIVVAVVGASFLVPAASTTADNASWVGFGTFATLAAVILVTTPLQAAGEEYAFRGYLSQAVGAWARHPVVPILVTSLLFGLAHGTQNAPLFLDRFAFGLVAGFLVWRTGGLEASIALHVMNNLVVLLLGAAYTDFGSQLTQTQAPWATVAFDAVQLTIYVVIVEAVRRSWVRRGRLALRTGGEGAAVDGL
jgi:membrane protease YdiL (CAAX protease family)